MAAAQQEYFPGLVPGRPYSFAELAKRAKMDTKTMRRWLLRAHLAQPEVGAVQKQGGEDSHYIVDIAKVGSYRGWESFSKRFLREDEANALQQRVRDLERTVSALRARVAGSEREVKESRAKVEWVVSMVQRASGKKYDPDEVTTSEALARSSRVAAG